jgi:MazG family protein
MLKNTQQLLDIMARLRHPEDGCAWDVKQDFASLIPYVIEEAYEVVDAIERNDMDDLCSELGDLLLQVVFHAQIAAERGHFTFEEVSEAICDKLVRRHPHVFADAIYTSDAERHQAWEQAKADERQEKNKTPASWMVSLPAYQPYSDVKKFRIALRTSALTGQQSIPYSIKCKKNLMKSGRPGYPAIKPT